MENRTEKKQKEDLNGAMSTLLLEVKKNNGITV